MLAHDIPALILAPMQGVTDAPMRQVQSESGAFTFAVSEFVRVTNLVPPAHVFHRDIPELRQGSRTPGGLPIAVQLLGGCAERMAAAAVFAHQLGAIAIDINFGCPAPTVNRHDGGATLLRYPNRIHEIVREVRRAVPHHVPVSAKLRLGWDSTDDIDTNAEMAAAGGASWITIHGRTRNVGYAPPIHWEPIGRVRKRLPIPVVANGDIWTIDDFRRCQDTTGCRHYMLGRGALANPLLAGQIAVHLGIKRPPLSLPQTWCERLQRLSECSRATQQTLSQTIVHRMKQWLRLAAAHGDFQHFDKIKRARNAEELLASLAAIEEPLAAVEPQLANM